MSKVKENAFPFTLSVILHAALGALFVLSLEFTPKSQRQLTPEVNVIEAVAVDESKIQYELDKIKKAEQRKKDEEDRRQRELESDAQRAKRLRETEEQHIAELKKKKELEKQSLTQLEKKKKADTELAAKEQEHIKKLKKDSEELALKNKQEQQEVQKLETKRKMEEEQAADRARQEALKKKQESERIAKEREAKKVVGDFKSQIKAKVESVWIKPTNFAPGSECTVAVKLIPTGDVVDSKLSNCSGDDIFSRSVEAAVQKASPLPVPKDDPEAFNLMREINFVFKPQ